MKMHFGQDCFQRSVVNVLDFEMGRGDNAVLFPFPVIGYMYKPDGIGISLLIPVTI